MSIPFFNIGKSPKKNKIIIFAKQAIPCSMVAGIVIGGLAILGKRIEAKDCYRFVNHQSNVTTIFQAVARICFLKK